MFLFYVYKLHSIIRISLKTYKVRVRRFKLSIIGVECDAKKLTLVDKALGMHGSERASIRYNVI